MSSTTINREDPQELRYAGVNAFWHEHQWPGSLTDPDVIDDATGGINRDFLSCRGNAGEIAARLVKLMESGVGDCLGCRNVATRIVMMIEDLETEVSDLDLNH